MQDRINCFTDLIESMDTTDLLCHSDASVERRMGDWGYVSHISAIPNEDSVKVEEDRLTAAAEIEIYFNDRGCVTLNVTIEAVGKEDGLTLCNITMAPALV